MIESSRQVQEGLLYQGVDEEIKYRLTTTPWGSSPSSPSAVIKTLDGVDVSSTCLSGSASVSGDVITLPTVKSLTAGVEYRLEIKFAVGGNIMEAWARVVGQM